MSLRGDRLRNLRVQHGYTQEMLAERLDLGIRQIHRYEKHLSDPAGDIVDRIARELNTTTDYLLGLTENPLLPAQKMAFSFQELQLIEAIREQRYKIALQILQAEILRTSDGSGSPLDEPRKRKPAANGDKSRRKRSP